MTSEVVFEVTQEDEGGYSARAVGLPIFTQAETWAELGAMALDAVRCHFDEEQAPKTIRLHLLREQVLSAA